MKKIILFMGLVFPVVGFAAPSSMPRVRLLVAAGPLSQMKVQAILAQSFDLTQYREVGVLPVMDTLRHLDHLLVHLHVKNSHRLIMAAVYLDNQQNVTRVIPNYHLTEMDRAAQPGSTTTATCPDPTVEFIAFAPNTDSTEQSVTVAVAQAATSAGLKVVQLLEQDATRANYLNYMACPNLKGNFYDGDSNPDEFVTVDGVIMSTDMAAFNFNYKVTNIWVACEAFNDPMKTTLITTAESQKYAAGINDLEVGPSDNAAKCAMIAAINGQPMTASFQACLKQYDNSSDQWGFDGSGADTFTK